MISERGVDMQQEEFQPEKGLGFFVDPSNPEDRSQWSFVLSSVEYFCNEVLAGRRSPVLRDGAAVILKTIKNKYPPERSRDGVPLCFHPHWLIEDCAEYAADEGTRTQVAIFVAALYDNAAEAAKRRDTCVQKTTHT